MRRAAAGLNGRPTDETGIVRKKIVDRRFADRYDVRFDVRLTVLGAGERTIDGYITDISESGIGVTLPLALAEGDIVQLKVADTTLFGFAIHSAREETGWRAGIEVQRVLIGGSELSRLLHSALRQSLPNVPGVLAGSPSN